jgi:hypothetical protein
MSRRHTFIPTLSLAQVARVLRPGGYFLYTDFRNPDAFAASEAALIKPPLPLRLILTDQGLTRAVLSPYARE